MKPQVDILDVAKLIILYGSNKGFLVTNKRLQTFLYQIQAFYFAIFDYNLYLNDELPEAWVNGPTFRTIYEKYKGEDYNKPLYFDSDDVDYPWDNQYDKITSILKDETDAEFPKAEIIMNVVDQIAFYDNLSLNFHVMQDRPWLDARSKKGDFEPSTDLLNEELIKAHYKYILEKNKIKKNETEK